MNASQIMTMTATDLLSADNIYEMQNEPDEIREQLKAMMYARLAELNADKILVQQVKKMFSSFEKADKLLSAEYTRNNAIKNASIPLAFDGQGKPIATIDNFMLILRNDPYFSSLMFNQLSYSPEHVVNGKVEKWQDKDDSKARLYIENNYKIHNREKLDDALRVLFSEREYHPIKEKIESVTWDGTPRITELFIKWLKCDDTLYTREVTRLVFAGGIHRLYNPGCKFDDVAVLIGTKQGEGKSSFVRWLALHDDWFTEISEFEGERAMQALEGVWICEISELLALTRAKEVESAKAFITRLNDRRKIPYDRRVTDHKRQCIFIGTTNKEQFLSDKTGGRRWYPLKVKSNGYSLYDHKEEIQADILQCWAEAKHLYDCGALQPYADRKLVEEIRERQSDAAEDDYRIGLIEKYLETHDRVCIIEIWQNALDNTYTKPTRKESNEISLILQSFNEFERAEKNERDSRYGVQRFWHRKEQKKIERIQIIEDII